MRFLSLFFAFYFACLSTLTCADEVAVCQDQTQTIVAASSHADCSAADVGDWCSPLCQCHCCGGAVSPLPSLAAPALQNALEWGSTERHAHSLAAAPTRAPAAVWQPPRV
ncbi:DUF6660 family protein [Hymenobacter sp. HSC-4F20]|uniref:DUF6660 family protein n=1 Tax=Hymenobacter sp. HSC-4F20 TaxID=2864135 RepID=UPI0038F68ECF